MFQQAQPTQQLSVPGSAAKLWQPSVKDTVRVFHTDGGYLGHTGSIDQQTDTDFIVNVHNSGVTFCPMNGGAGRFARP